MAQFNAEVFDQGMLNMRSSIRKHSVVTSYQPSNVFNLSDSSDEESEEDVNKFSFSLARLLHLKRDSSRGGNSSSGTPSGASTPATEIAPSQSQSSILEVDEEKEESKTIAKPASRSSTKLKNSSSTESLSERLGFKSLGRKSGSNELTGSGGKFKDLLMPPSMQRRGSVSSEGSDRSSTVSRTSSEVSFEEKYGCTECVLGKGSFATVKLYCQGNPKTGIKYAVKEFRKRRREEPMVLSF